MVAIRRLLSIHCLNIGKQVPFIKGTKDGINISCNLFRKNTRQTLGLPVFDQLRYHYLLSQPGNFGTVHVIGLNLQIDRDFQDSNHSLYIVKRISAFVLKDSSGMEKFQPSGPGQFIRVQEICIKSNSVC